MTHAVWTYDNPADYAFDDNLASVSGGRARLKIITPQNATFHAPYTTDFDGVWGEGDLAGVAVGGPVVSGGRLDLLSGGFVRYPATGKLTSVGTIQCVVYPGYSGAPAFQRVFFSYGTGPEIASALVAQHLADGNIRITFYDASGARQDFSGGAWSPTAGQPYVIELGFDLPAGELHFFINGQARGPFSIGTGQTFVQPLWIKIGTGPAESGSTQYEYDEVATFSDVQHTETHPAPGPIPDAGYITAPQRIAALEAVELQSITQAAGEYSAPGTTGVRFSVNDGNADYSWNGFEWGPCPNYACANDPTVFFDNLLTLPPGSYSPVAWLYSPDGTETPEVSQAEFFIELPDVGLGALNPITEAAATELLKNKITELEQIAGPYQVLSVTREGIYYSVAVDGDVAAALPGDLIRISAGTAAGAWIVQGAGSLLIRPQNEISEQAVPAGQATLYRIDLTAWSALLDAAMDRIKDLTGYTFDGLQEFVELRSGSGGPVLQLSRRYFHEDNLKIRIRDGLEISASEVRADPEAGQLIIKNPGALHDDVSRRARAWPRGKRNIEVTYTAGFESPPPDIIRAAAMLAVMSALDDSSSASGGSDFLTGQSADGYSESREGGGVWNARKRQLNGTAHEILSRYATIAGGH